MPHNELTQNLISSICAPVSILLRHEPLVHDFLRFRIVSLQKRLPDDRQTLRRIRIGIIHLTAAPKRYFIQDDMLFRRVAIRHHSHPAVTHRKHLLPDISR